MQKSLAVLALIILPLLLIGFASVGLADELIVKPSKPGEWILYDTTDQEVATLALVEDGAYSIRPKGGQYLGIIRANGDLHDRPPSGYVSERSPALPGRRRCNKRDQIGRIPLKKAATSRQRAHIFPSLPICRFCRLRSA